MLKKSLQVKFKDSPVERHLVSRMKFSNHSRWLSGGGGVAPSNGAPQTTWSWPWKAFATYLLTRPRHRQTGFCASKYRWAFSVWRFSRFFWLLWRSTRQLTHRVLGVQISTPVFDPIWSILKLIDLFWSSLNKFDPVWTSLNMFEHVWTCLSKFDLFGSSLNQFDPF